MRTDGKHRFMPKTIFNSEVKDFQLYKSREKSKVEKDRREWEHPKLEEKQYPDKYYECLESKFSLGCQ